jgi:hypothetical protein
VAKLPSGLSTKSEIQFSYVWATVASAEVKNNWYEGLDVLDRDSLRMKIDHSGCLVEKEGCAGILMINSVVAMNTEIRRQRGSSASLCSVTDGLTHAGLRENFLISGVNLSQGICTGLSNRGSRGCLGKSSSHNCERLLGSDDSSSSSITIIWSGSSGGCGRGHSSGGLLMVLGRSISGLAGLDSSSRGSLGIRDA